MQLKEQFSSFVAQNLTGGQYKLLPFIVMEEITKTGNLDFKHLWLINEVLPFMNETGLGILETRYPDLIEIIKEKANKADVTWQQVIKAFEFRAEARKIDAFLDDANLTNDIKNDIRVCLLANECQFDLATVKAF